jgi:hypothetical protein
MLFLAAVFLPLASNRQEYLEAEGTRISAEAINVSGLILSSKPRETCSENVSYCSWSAVVKFSYEIRGSQYTGEQSWGVKDGGQAARQAAQYPGGTAAPLYYHPSDPAKAWLKGPKPPVGLSLWYLPTMILGLWGAIILAGGLYYPGREANTF